MAFPLWAAMAAGAGLGLLKNREQQKQINAQNEAEVAKTRFSPWTGMQGQIQAKPSMFGDVASGALSGAMFGQQFSGGSTPQVSEPTPMTEQDVFAAASRGSGRMARFSPYSMMRPS